MNNTERMLDLAAQLAALYKTRAELTLREWQYGKDAEGRKLYLAPAEGWPGKNAEERKTAMERYFAADEVLGKIEAQADQVHVELVQCEALIAGLEAERRALEYTVKAGLVEALMRTPIDRDDTDPYEAAVELRVTDGIPF